MATSAFRLVPQVNKALGMSPRRLMTARRDWTGKVAAGRRTADSRGLRRIERFLIALRRAGRRAILIVDSDCGDGERLIQAANRARALGFLVVDAEGYDRSREHVALASRAAAARGDPTVRFRFAARDAIASAPFCNGRDAPADVLLTSNRGRADDLADAVDRDGLLIRHR